MIIRAIKILSLLLMFILSLSACGQDAENEAPQAAKASLKLAGVMPNGQSVVGVQMTLSFPPGVTAKIDPATGDVADSVIRIVGPGELKFTGVTYQPSTETTGGTLVFFAVNLDGFSLGDFLSVTLDITPGTIPKAEEFGLSEVSVSDLDGIVIENLQPVMTVKIQ